MEIARLDFAEGLKAKKIKVGPMLAVVEVANLPKDVEEAFKKEKLINDVIILAVVKQLNDSKKKVQEALIDFDDKFQPSGDKNADEDKIKQLNSQCAQICKAQQGVAESVALKKWQEYVSRKDAWKKCQIKFGCKIAFTSIGLGVSVATAAVSGGATAVAVLGMAKKVYDLGKEVYEFAKSISAVEDNIVTIAAALSKHYGGPSVQKLDWKANAKEVVNMLVQIPGFDKGTTALKDKLTQHRAKLGQLEAKAESAHGQASQMMKKLEEMEKTTKGTVLAEKAKALGQKVDVLLDKASDLNGTVQEGETFNQTMTAMNEQFIAKTDPKIRPLRDVVEYVSAAGEVAGLAKDVFDLATAIAA